MCFYAFVKIFNYILECSDIPAKWGAQAIPFTGHGF